MVRLERHFCDLVGGLELLFRQKDVLKIKSQETQIKMNTAESSEKCSLLPGHSPASGAMTHEFRAKIAGRGGPGGPLSYTLHDYET